MILQNDPESAKNSDLSAQNFSADVTLDSVAPIRNSGRFGSDRSKADSETQGFDANSGIKIGSVDSRTKSSLRIRYEAEVKIIRRKLGDLEQIRATLGLSQRKMSQLLFVDPSAWTRWTKQGEVAPPHIYRMLQWYLALEDKYPALDTTFWLSAVAKIRAPVEDQRELEVLRESHEELRREVRALREEAAIRASARVSVPSPTPTSGSALDLSRWVAVGAAILMSFLIGFGFAALLRH